VKGVSIVSRLKSRALGRAILTYAAVVVLALCLSTVRHRAFAEADTANAQPAAAGQTVAVRPYFSLSTNRTYGTADRARVWINYQGIDHLDFRVYRVKDPVTFFKKLNDPHKMGEREKTEITASHEQKPSVIEKIHAFKVSVFGSIKNYVRKQLRRDNREVLSQKFLGEGDRLPLNVADFARVPLLNPDQLIGSWREMLKPLDNDYDNRMVILGKREPGVYLVEAVNGDLRAYTVAISTDLTVVNKTNRSGEMLVYAVDRKSGAPRSGVDIEIVKGKKTLAKGTTNASGILQTHIALEKPKEPEHPEDFDYQEGDNKVGRDSYLVMGSDRTNFGISDLEPYYFGGYGGEGEDAEQTNPGKLTGYVYTDRPVYRPGQKVYFKAIVRRLGDGQYQMINARSVHVTIEDPSSQKVLDKDMPVSARGTLSGDLDIGGAAPLGSYTVTVTADGASATGRFEVQEYKKPEYKVSVSVPKQYVPVGEKVKFGIEAKYFFGAPVNNADVQYYIYRSHYYHWWWSSGDQGDDLGESMGEEGDDTYYGYGNDMVKDGQGSLDANGRMQVEFEVPQPDKDNPVDYTYRLEAHVTDASRRTIEGKASFVGTRGNIVAYAQPERYVYYQNDPAKIKITTADYEGHPVSAKVTLKFILRTWERVEKEDEDKYKRYEYVKHERELASGDVTTSNGGEASYDFTPPVIGSVYIKTLVDDSKKKVESLGGYMWVADRSDKWADFATEDYDSIKLVPDKKSYQPGETAHVLAMLPSDGVHLLVTTELERIMTARTVDAPGRAVMIDVPIETRYAPNFFLDVTFVKDAEMFTHDQSISVPARNKFLTLEVLTNKKEYKPGDPASYTILARNSNGSPAAGAEVSLGVVDESIYSVSPDQSGDIRKKFYGRRYNQIQTQFSVSYTFSGYSADKQPVNLSRNNRAAYQLADFKNEAQYKEPTIRKEFKDTAFWQPDVVTGADGKATVNFKMPDNLTTWRATVRAVTPDTRVGSSLAKVVARKDLILRLETPRFLTEGDTVTLSGIVHNYLNSDKATQISLSLTGVAQLTSQATTTVTIPRQGEYRMDWRVAAPKVGQVSLVATAKTDAESDGVELPLQVVPVGLRRTTGGVTAVPDESADKTIALNIPENANTEARALRIEVSPSVASSLFGALDYLTGYPYGCTEQTMSSFLPNVVVTQTLKDVKTASIRASNDLGKKVQRGLERLYDYQHGDGGWGWWKNDKSDPFMTAYVLDGLTMASRAGYSIDKDRIASGRNKLNQMIAAGKGDDGKPFDVETRAYMVYALNVSGTADAGYLNDLFNRRNELQPYGRALLALTLKQRSDASRARQVAGEIEGTARANEFDAHWESRRRPMLDFTEVDDIEATALSLKALCAIAPTSGLLPKVARWLMANRRYGYYWDSTKQTSFAIMGLTDYVKVSKELSPDYSVEIYLNGQQVLTRRMTSADLTGGSGLVIERKGGQLSDSNQLRVVKQGRGVLYVSSTLEYFTRGDDVAAQSSPELSLTREYLRLKVVETGGKGKWSVEPLKGELHSGDLIVSRLHLKGSRGQYLMIEDPIPAGCEQVGRVSGINLDYSENRWCDWYSSREFRDQKTVLFLSYFGGDTTYQNALRVQVPGEFKAAPARAEQMYQPTVQSNTGTARMTILDKVGKE
jgi:uncharacterized protein YfaS (alpha-2-macroglobulin family)